MTEVLEPTLDINEEVEMLKYWVPVELVEEYFEQAKEVWQKDE